MNTSYLCIFHYVGKRIGQPTSLSRPALRSARSALRSVAASTRRFVNNQVLGTGQRDA